MAIIGKVRKGIEDRADGYLNGTYDPKAAARKTAIKGVTTAIVLVSLLTGIAFSSPADINEDQSAANYRPAPIVMDIDEFANATVDDEEDDVDEEKQTKLGFFARFRQAVLSLPQTVRLLIITPLWLIGTGLMAVVSFLWNILFQTPVGAFIASFALGFAILTGLFVATAHTLFPDIPIRKLLCKRNILFVGLTALLLSFFDALAPMYWHSYPMAAGLLKLVFGASVIGLISYRTKKKLSLHSLV